MDMTHNVVVAKTTIEGYIALVDDSEKTELLDSHRCRMEVKLISVCNEERGARQRELSPVVTFTEFPMSFEATKAVVAASKLMAVFISDDLEHPEHRGEALYEWAFGSGAISEGWVLTLNN